MRTLCMIPENVTLAHTVHARWHIAQAYFADESRWSVE